MHLGINLQTDFEALTCHQQVQVRLVIPMSVWFKVWKFFHHAYHGTVAMSLISRGSLFTRCICQIFLWLNLKAFTYTEVFSQHRNKWQWFSRNGLLTWSSANNTSSLTDLEHVTCSVSLPFSLILNISREGPAMYIWLLLLSSVIGSSASSIWFL